MTHSEGFCLFDSRILWPFATPGKADWRRLRGLPEPCTEHAYPL